MISLIDAPRSATRDFRQRIMAEIDDLYTMSRDQGINPYKVNVITFCGHGITHPNGDAIGIVYDTIFAKGDDGKPLPPNSLLRFINFDSLARKFAALENTITVFVLSMCRSLLTPEELNIVQK